MTRAWLLGCIVVFALACGSGGDGDGAADDDSSTEADDATHPATGASVGTSGSDATLSASGADDSGPTSAEESGSEGGNPPPGWPPVCDSEAPYPSPDWPVEAPEDHGLDPAALEEAAAYAESVESHCLIVVRDGAVVFERYWMDTDETTKNQSWSVAKSYTSTIVGIALAKGDFGGLEDSIADYLPEFAGTDKDAVTLRHLLTMTAGIYVDLLDDMIGMFTAVDMTEKAMSIELTGEPGSMWQYSNAAVQMFEPIFRLGLGTSADDYAEENLFDRIGMDAEWDTDMEGNPSMYMNVLASCRDHAKFGYLHLQDGCWDGEQIVPEDWVADATGASTDMNRGYGYYWWLSGGEPTLDFIDSTPLARGSLHPGGPDDSFCAVGLGSQVIEVVPAHDMVIVRMGRSAVEDLEGNLLPLFEIIELLNEGKQEVHNEVIQRVLAAITE